MQNSDNPNGQLPIGIQKPSPAPFRGINRCLYMLVACTVLPALLIISYTGFSQREQAIQDANKRFLEITNSIANLQVEKTNQSRMLLKTLATLPEIQNMDVLQCNVIFQRIVRDNPTLANIVLLNPQGDVLAAALPFTGSVDMSDRTSVMDAVRARDFSAGDSMISRMAKVPAMQFSYPVIDDGGVLTGVLSISYNLEKYDEYFEPIELPYGSRFIFVDRHGVRWMWRSWQAEPMQIGVPIVTENWRNIIDSDRDSGQFTTTRYDGVEAFFHFRKLRLKVDDPPYLVVLMNIPRELAFADANRTLKINLALLAVATLLALIIAKLLGQVLMGRQMNALWGNEERLRIILDSLPSAVIGTDVGQHITHFNHNAQVLLGKSYEDVAGEELLKALPSLPFTHEQLRSIRSEINSLRYEKTTIHTILGIRMADIVVYPVDASSLDLVVIITDVTERVRLEGVMVQTEKMMSLGGLAAGMAHEINNPLGGILLGMQVLCRRLQDDTLPNRAAAQDVGCSLEKIQAYAKQRGIIPIIEAVRDAAIRAAKIVQDMLSFSRQPDSSLLSQNVTDLLDNAVELCSNDYNLMKKYDFRHIRIERYYQPELPSVSCVRTQIEQVFMNLLRNAAQAMEANSENCPSPMITLRTKKLGHYVVIEIEDNGPGMDKSIRDRIFEPFFTTKPPGIGTGLGLSVSYFIITNSHKGSLEVESAPGRGARFIIKLPLGKALVSTIISESVAV